MSAESLIQILPDGTRSARIAGMMSGTSVDSIDIAICDLKLSPTSERIQIELCGFQETPISSDLRSRIFQLFQNDKGSLSLACSLNFEIAMAFAQAFRQATTALNIPPQSVSAIASHGQTAWHIAPHMADKTQIPSTLQLGDGSVLAHHTQTPVIFNFRTADMAALGNGAPLVPFSDWQMFGQPGKTTILLNIGGIANVTILPPTDKPTDIVAFDTGPGNMIIDAAAEHFFGQSYDADGMQASHGTVSQELLEQWMAIPYIDIAPPKSTGRELFGKHFTQAYIERNCAMKPQDFLATATMYTAKSIARNLRPWLSQTDTILAAGGGVNNPTLSRMLTAELERVSGKTIHLKHIDEVSVFPAKARECIAFAILGFATLCDIPSNVPNATGATCPKRLGCLAIP